LGGDGKPETAYGVDGCRAGWFYIALVPCQEAAWGVVETVGELVAGASGSDRILVDTPIGLPDGPEGRVCDTEARARLGWPRASSVFPAPVRAALAATTYVEARRINREASGKGLTRQTFGILPGIREVDLLLQESPKAQRIVRETHPEICFWALAGDTPMEHGKKTGLGFDERFQLLKCFRPTVCREFGQIRAQFRCWDLADDDILDAMAAAITASAKPSALSTLPARPRADSVGLPMEIVYAPTASLVIGG